MPSQSPTLSPHLRALTLSAGHAFLHHGQTGDFVLCSRDAAQELIQGRFTGLSATLLDALFEAGLLGEASAPGRRADPPILIDLRASWSGVAALVEVLEHGAHGPRHALLPARAAAAEVAALGHLRPRLDITLAADPEWASALGPQELAEIEAANLGMLLVLRPGTSEGDWAQMRALEDRLQSYRIPVVCEFTIGSADELRDLQRRLADAGGIREIAFNVLLGRAFDGGDAGALRSAMRQAGAAASVRARWEVPASRLRSGRPPARHPFPVAVRSLHELKQLLSGREEPAAPTRESSDCGSCPIQGWCCGLLCDTEARCHSISRECATAAVVEVCLAWVAASQPEPSARG